MAFGWTRNENNSEMLRMGKKRIAWLETIWEDGNKLEPWIFKRTDQDLGEILLRSSNVENDDEKHHQELLRHSGMKNWKGWTNDEKNLKDLGERHLTDDNSFLRQTL